MKQSMLCVLLFILIPVTGVFAAHIDIKANGSDGPITIATTDVLTVTVSLDPGIYAGETAHWWVLASAPNGWYYYDHFSGSWKRGFTFTYQGPLFNLPSRTVLERSGLPVGEYELYFLILLEGVPYSDKVNVIIQ